MAVTVTHGLSHGKDARVLVGGYDWSSEFTDASLTEESGSLDRTGLGSAGWRRHVAGQRMWNLSLTALYDRRTSGSDPLENSDYFTERVGEDARDALIVAPAGAAAGQPAVLAQGFLVVSAGTEHPRDELLTLSIDLAGSGPLRHGVVLVAPVDVPTGVSPWNSPSVDMGAQAGPLTARLALNVEEVSGTVTADLSHGTDDSAFDALTPTIDLAQRGTVWAEFEVPAPGRYWRLRITKDATQEVRLTAALVLGG